MGRKAPGTPRRVLVVDDDAVLGEFVGAVLGEKGYSVDHVLSGEEALTLLREDSTFDLVLMDIRLGNQRMTGGEAASEISTRFDLPIVFYSAFTDEETLRETDCVPSYGYVQKTSDGENVLVRSVRRSVAQHERLTRFQQESARARILVGEAHHRIKNNLAVLAARLRLEAPDLPQECRPLTDRFRGHVHSIEKLHGLLQEDGSTGRVALRTYLHQVLSALFDKESPIDVLFAVAGANLKVAAKTAASVGMIVSELAMNSVKHSFSSEALNSFEIVLARRGDDAVLRVTTSGHPIPTEANLRTGSLGMRLVNILTRQLRGSLLIRKAPRPEFILSFPLSHEPG